jgi:hypothetical protein
VSKIILVISLIVNFCLIAFLLKSIPTSKIFASPKPPFYIGLPFWPNNVYSKSIVGEGDFPHFEVTTRSIGDDEFISNACQTECSIETKIIGQNEVRIMYSGNHKNPVSLFVIPNSDIPYGMVYSFQIDQINKNSNEPIEFCDGQVEQWLESIRQW